MPGFLKVLPPIAYRDRFAFWEEANRFAAQSFEDVIMNEDPETVAGIRVEPIGNTGGIITPTEEYFRIPSTVFQFGDIADLAVIVFVSDISQGEKFPFDRVLRQESRFSDAEGGFIRVVPAGFGLSPCGARNIE